MKKDNSGFSLGLETFKKILYMEQTDLHHYVLGRIEEYFDKDDIYEVKGEYIYAKGTVPVLLCAHLDTVHRIKPTPDTLFHDQVKNVMWCPNGIGGDDRCGVFNILDILDKGYLPHVVFSWDEEIGGVGASSLVSTIETYFGNEVTKAFNEINFAIQFDRHGFNEAVYYDLDSQSFEDYISSFGFKTEWGSYTDICEYCPEFGFAGVNIAAGYTNEHTDRELVYVNEMLSSQIKVINILEDQIEDPVYFEYIATPYAYNGWGGYGYGGYSSKYPKRRTDANGKPSYNFNKFDNDEIYPVGFEEEYEGDIDPHNYQKEVECQYCMQSKSMVEWDETSDPVQNKLCNECRKVFQMENQ